MTPYETSLVVVGVCLGAIAMFALLFLVVYFVSRDEQHLVDDRKQRTVREILEEKARPPKWTE